MTSSSEPGEILHEPSTPNNHGDSEFIFVKKVGFGEESVLPGLEFEGLRSRSLPEIGGRRKYPLPEGWGGYIRVDSAASVFYWQPQWAPTAPLPFPDIWCKASKP